MTKRTAVAVRVTTRPAKPVVPPDIREMEAAEKALQESYNSLSRHLRMHRGCRDEGLAPNAGSILYKLWISDKLTKQQLYGWQCFYDDVKAEWGSSNSLVASMNGGGASEGNYPSREMQRSRVGPSARLTKEGVRANEVLGRLHNHERGLLEQLVRDAYHTEGNKEIHRHTLPYLGNILAGYRDNRQCIAAAVSAIQRLLSSLGEAYGLEPFET